MTGVAYRATKRGLDLLLTLPTVVATVPAQAAIAIAIRSTMGSPVLFRQVRPGLGGDPFEMVKFRTMLHPNPSGDRITDPDRITKLGAFLRSSSLDELPTLWNVLRGEMSLVGPRPLLMHYLERYTAEQARRHEVRPGLTGLAQVSGRNAISWAEKFRLDIEYVDNASLLMDLRIIARTLVAVLRRDGISAEGTVSMPEFMGETRTGFPR